jgi:uncharacterized protein YbaP (TraB family)
MHRERKFFGVATALVCLFLPVLALAEATATAAGTKHCFWTVAGKSNTVYLLGSVHALSKKFYPLDKPIEEAFARSERLILEVDYNEMEGPETKLNMLQMGHYPEGDSLKNHVSKETYDNLAARLKKIGASAATFDSFKPWMVSLKLLAVELHKLGFSIQDGVDRYFYNKATEAGKKVEGLETADFHMSLLNDLNQAEGESMLKESFGEIDNLEKEFETLTEAWKNGNTKKIEETMVKHMSAYPDLYKKLVVERNQRWSRQVDKLLAGGKDVFVVVGVAHLAGKDSLVDMLKHKGYKVVQE